MKLFGKTSRYALVAVAAMAFTISTANAQETITANASVTVQNSFSLVQTAPISFGTLVAARRGAGGGAVATYAVSAAAATTGVVTNVGGPNDDFILEVASGDRATIDITGAIASTAMVITLPSAPITLTCGACSGAQPAFSVGTFVDDGADNAVTTDGTGAATFYVGATLSTVAGVNNYEDGSYAGTYSITVGY